MKFVINVILFILTIHYTVGDLKEIVNNYYDDEETRIDIIAEIINNNLKDNGWNNLFFVGTLPNKLYHKLQKLQFTNTVINIEEDEVDIEAVVPYHSNFILISCSNFNEFEVALKKIQTSAYWHPLANIILYYHAQYEKESLAKIFFAFWYYRAINVIIIQYNDTEKLLQISHFNPYMSDHYKLKNLFGCWTAMKIEIPIESFTDSFLCVSHCHNISMHKLRANNLGTCIGFETHLKQYKNKKSILNLSIFDNKAKNLHGFKLRAFTMEVLPFLGIKKHENDTYTLHYRDGMIWNTMAELLNFTIDLSGVNDLLIQKFDFQINIQKVFEFTLRKLDIILFPIYQFDLIIAEVDNTYPFMDSGVCFLSSRADFETIVFNAKLLLSNVTVIIEFLLCFLCTWFVFFIFSLEKQQRFSYDQVGKDLINTFRTVLSISIYNSPKRGSFRIFLTISIWCFFVINFNTQAAIISLFSVHKRGKDVDTFEDIINKGYKIEGMASPDVVLPDTEEKYIIITARIVAVPDMFVCVNNMVNDSRRFCIIDCAVGRYLVRNMLDGKGEQFLHIVSDARIHSHYLNMVLHKNSPLTDKFNKYIMRLFEAGIIKKWMDYRFKNIREEVPIEPLGMEEMEGIFKGYCFLVLTSTVVFVIEVLIGCIQRAKKIWRWRKIMTRPLKLIMTKIFYLKKNRKVKHVNTSSETI